MGNFKCIKAIVKREFLAYFNSALAYVFLTIFLVMGALLTFNFADWFSVGSIINADTQTIVKENIVALRMPGTLISKTGRWKQKDRTSRLNIPDGSGSF